VKAGAKISYPSQPETANRFAITTGEATVGGDIHVGIQGDAVAAGGRRLDQGKDFTLENTHAGIDQRWRRRHIQYRRNCSRLCGTIADHGDRSVKHRFAGG
jgi:hypothetical protein